MKQKTMNMYVGLCSMAAIVSSLATGNILKAAGENASSPLPILLMLVGVIAWVAYGFCAYVLLSVGSGIVWGIKIKSGKSFKRNTLISAICMLALPFISIKMIICQIGLGFSMLFSGQPAGMILMLIFSVLDIAGLFVGTVVAQKICTKQLSKEKNAKCLGKLDIFKEIDSNMDQAEAFIVSFEGVALVNKANYCYAVYLYENYQLGALTVPEEVALVGTYFVQKYYDRYNFKVDMEVIPGEPGQLVVAVGTGGIAVGRTAGTKDQRIFRSYIFTRR